jgi:hypothetical protein
MCYTGQIEPGYVAACHAKAIATGDRSRYHGAMLSNRLSNDYFIITGRDPRLPIWSWEILRRSQPLGVKLIGHDFESAMAARLAGERALKDLLHGIARNNP